MCKLLGRVLDGNFSAISGPAFATFPCARFSVILDVDADEAGSDMRLLFEPAATTADVLVVGAAVLGLALRFNTARGWM